MRTIRRSFRFDRRILAFLPLLSLAFVGCVTAPRPTAPDAAASQATEDALAAEYIPQSTIRTQYGNDFLDDPYVAPSATLLPTYNDYVVIRIGVSAPSGGHLEVFSIRATDQKNRDQALYMKRQNFMDFVNLWAPDQSQVATRSNKITWYYLPSDRFDVPAGVHTYLVVLIGRHPIPDGVTAHLDLSLNHVEQVLDVPITSP